MSLTRSLVEGKNALWWTNARFDEENRSFELPRRSWVGCDKSMLQCSFRLIDNALSKVSPAAAVSDSGSTATGYRYVSSRSFVIQKECTGSQVARKNVTILQ